jgi:peptidyl-prolyl cis-trans isomerase B (cyclophilin B)
MSKTMKSLIAGLIVLALATAGVVIYAKLSEPDYSNVPYPTVTITMESGDEIHLELYPDIAPNTVANFVQLAQEGFYDGTIFHRVIAGFMIQGGDPTGTGMGGPGFTIKGEFSANGVDNNLSHTRGVISMARSQSYDSAGSQFFIMHADAPYLDGQYAAFGRVTDEESLAVVDAIATTLTDSNDKPLSEWKIKSITVDTHGYDYKAVRIES